MSEPRIRPGTPQDAAAVAAIWEAGWRDGHLGHVPEELVRLRTPETFRARAAARVDDTAVAVVDGEVAGFVMVVRDEVDQVYVGKDHRGGGVAALLLAEAERLVAAGGHSQAWLAVATGNARARRFYERQGWTDEGAFEHEAPVGAGSIAVACHRLVKHLRPALAERLDLQPHPEGGWYRQSWVSPETVLLGDGRARATATLIYFLLPAGESSAWHRVASDEIWLAHLGRVTLELGGTGSAPGEAETILVGTDPSTGERPQALVPAGVWQRTVPADADALVSCVVSPGFDFADFELAES
jgi:predicted cupin superfamily sugar epimerase/ribosomal protein S18 acetylase RimI-like enzyme